MIQGWFAIDVLTDDGWHPRWCCESREDAFEFARLCTSQGLTASVREIT